ncbi:hypothetical protein [Xylocopilactobacillus apis]|uniref:Uncharacterized protein n=1 Tax=Xylocopilactobacillus apis TaxID=2932183 RepID=A0AAU9CTV0_9LACO|nr:hypothetical protein [Xylocopilactobacillus apis]BDR55776.1 hypothetical protein KIMC2_03380 [Xylocopilactobacillus apis]
MTSLLANQGDQNISDGYVMGLLQRLYELSTADQSNLENEQEFLDLCDFYKDCNSQDNPIRYSPISGFVLNKGEEIHYFIDVLKESCRSKYSDSMPYGINKMLDHIELAGIQVKQTQNLEAEILSQTKQLGKIENKSDELEKRSASYESKLESSQVKIYTSFIAIIGLFSSLIFSLFGGFKSTVDIAATKSPTLSHVLVSISSIGIVMICAIFVFFRLLLKLIKALSGEDKSKTNLPIYNMIANSALRLLTGTLTGVNQNKEEEKKNFCQKNPDFVGSIVCLLIVLLIGVLLSFAGK